MTIELWMLSLSLLLIATHFFRRIFAKILLTSSAVVIVIGALFSLLITWFEIDTGLRWDNLSQFILNLLLPIMVFAGACRFSRKDLIDNWRLVLFLSLPGLLTSVAVGAVILYLALYWYYPIGFLTAVAAAFIFSSSDTFCLSEYFHDKRSYNTCVQLLEKESVATDTLIVLGYTFLFLYSTHPNEDLSSWNLAGLFAVNFFGEILVGSLIAFATWHIVSRCSDRMHRQLIGLALGFLALGLCQLLFLSIGLIAIFLTGLASGDAESHHSSPTEGRQILSELVGYLCGVLILFLVGLSMTADMFIRYWPAMLVAIFATWLARLLLVFILPRLWLSGLDRKFLWLGYSQCAISAALSLSLPFEFDNWYLVQSMTYGIAIATLIIKGPILALTLKKQLFPIGATRSL